MKKVRNSEFVKLSIPNYGKPNSGFDPLLWKGNTSGEGSAPVAKKKEHPMVKFISGGSKSFNTSDQA